MPLGAGWSVTTSARWTASPRTWRNRTTNSPRSFWKLSKAFPSKRASPTDREQHDGNAYPEWLDASCACRSGDARDAARTHARARVGDRTALGRPAPGPSDVREPQLVGQPPGRAVLFSGRLGDRPIWFALGDRRHCSAAGHRRLATERV